jgi:hypothetical protein
VGASGLLVPGASAAKLPAWARPVVESAPPVPEGVPPHSARVLFSEVRDEVRPDGSFRIRRRFATQALSVNTWEVGTGGFYFDDTAKVTSTRAWHLPPGERAKKSWSSPVDITLGDSFLTDAKVRAVAVKEVKKGSIVLFEFGAIQTPYFLPRHHLFYEGAPIEMARYQLQVPPRWMVVWDWLRLDGPEPEIEGNVWTWELRDLPAPEEEPLGDRAPDGAPILAVNIIPAEGSDVQPAVLATWDALSRWYEDLARGRHDLSPQVAEAARSIQSGIDPAPFPRIKGAGEFVRDKVRYVAVELGIGGFQPRPASDTLENLYGDCKDKATLLRSLLSSWDRPSYPVLVNLSSPGTVSEKVPLPSSFNHLIAAVAIPDGEAVPDRFAHAVGEAGGLGRLLYVDATDEASSIGFMSASLSGKRALVVAGARGQLVTLPGTDPGDHRVERRIRADLGAGRRILFERRSTYTGEYARRARISFNSSSMNRRRSVERRILEIWPDARIENYEVEHEDQHGAFGERVSSRVRVSGDSGPGSQWAFFPGAGGELHRVPLGRRESAVDYGHARSILYEVILRGFPGSAELPEAASVQGDGWSVRSTYHREGGTLHGSYELRMARTRFEPKEFGELRRLWSAIRSVTSPSLNLAE